MQIGVITNPNSRKNKGRPNRVNDLERVLGNLGEVHQTQSVESIKPILRDFLRKKARFWVADGGDGALHWMLKAGQELFEEEEFKNGDYEFPLAVPTKGGTIDFVANNVGIQGSAEDILSALKSKLESGLPIEEIEVDSMLIEGIQQTNNGDAFFRTYGFAAAVGGIGQQFFTKYHESNDPNPKTIVKILGKAMAMLPLSISPFNKIKAIPKPLKQFANELFEPMAANVWLDGTKVEATEFSGVNIGSMSINLGGVFRLFSKADNNHQMQVILGSIGPMELLKNIPSMFLGGNINAEGIVDRPCMELKVESSGAKLLSPNIDGEFYEHVKEIVFRLGPRIRIPKIKA